MSRQFTGDEINEMISRLKQLEDNRGFRALLLHGRRDPSTEMESNGFTGPILYGIEYAHQTYSDTMAVGFLSREARAIAYDQTGWDILDEKTLEVRYHDDLIQVNELGCGIHYYGDIEFQVVPIK